MLKNLLSIRPVATDVGALLLRLGFGFLMFFIHGHQKAAMIGKPDLEFYNFLGLGAEFSLWLVVFAEFLCGLLIALGLFTRLAIIPLFITMMVAVFDVHGGDPIGKMEMGLLYLAGLSALFFVGAGRYSLDALLRISR